MDAAEWQRLAQGATKSITNTSLIKANYKVLLRWYMIPTRCAQRVSGPPPLCFRGCGQKGTAYHTQWTCPKICRFWFCTYNFTGTNLTKYLRQALPLPPRRGTPEAHPAPKSIYLYSEKDYDSKILEIPQNTLQSLSWIMFN